MGEVLRKILVVEDNEDNREVFVYRLQKLGVFEVLVASNGKEALKIAAQVKPDLIFMDLKMPVMDGWAATRALRQTEWGKDLPVIAVTAYAMKGDREKALDAGCNDFISKPIMDYSIIQRKIEEILG
ncbi:MAG: response regulator [Candidatus Binatia bacterium]